MDNDNVRSTGVDSWDDRPNEALLPVVSDVIAFVSSFGRLSMSNANKSLILQQQAELDASPFRFSEDDLSKMTNGDATIVMVQRSRSLMPNATSYKSEVTLTSVCERRERADFIPAKKKNASTQQNGLTAEIGGQRARRCRAGGPGRKSVRQEPLQK